jgi:hypothetical protein
LIDALGAPAPGASIAKLGRHREKHLLLSKKEAHAMQRLSDIKAPEPVRRGRRVLLKAIATVTAVVSSVAFSPSASEAAAGTTTLYAGEILQPGQFLASSGNVLAMQTDGNLVMYATNNIPLWSSNSSGNSGAWAWMQGDGNFVVYSSAATGHRPLFSTATNGRGGQRLVLQSDGNVVLYTASNVPLWSSNTYKQAYAVNRFGLYFWGREQWGCLDALWRRESGWNELARNPSSGAYGIPQALPGDKMAVEGADWRTNPFTQIRWGQSYIKQRYGTPCGAWSHSQRYGWY